MSEISVADYLDGHLSQLGVVGPGVVTAENEVASAGKHDPNRCSCAAAVTAIGSRYGGPSRGCRELGSGHGIPFGRGRAADARLCTETSLGDHCDVIGAVIVLVLADRYRRDMMCTYPAQPMPHRQ